MKFRYYKFHRKAFSLSLISNTCSRFEWVLLFAAATSLMTKAAPRSDSLSPEVQMHFGAAQQAQSKGDYNTAENEYGAVLKLAPDFAEVHMNLGLVYRLQSRD